MRNTNKLMQLCEQIESKDKAKRFMEIYKHGDLKHIESAAIYSDGGIFQSFIWTMIFDTFVDKLVYDTKKFFTIIEVQNNQLLGQYGYWPIVPAHYNDFEPFEKWNTKKKFWDNVIEDSLKFASHRSGIGAGEIKKFIAKGIGNIIKRLNYNLDMDIVPIGSLREIGLDPVIMKGVEYKLKQGPQLEQPVINNSIAYFAGDNRLPDPPNKPKLLNLVLKAAKILDAAGWVGYNKKTKHYEADDIDIKSDFIRLSFCRLDDYTNKDAKAMARKLTRELGCKVEFGYIPRVPGIVSFYITKGEVYSAIGRMELEGFGPNYSED